MLAGRAQAAPVAQWGSWRRLLQQCADRRRAATPLDQIASGPLSGYKVECCLAVVTKFVLEEHGSKLVVLSDGVGAVLATVHEAVLSAHPGVCAQGTALALQQVTVLEMDPSSRSLIICPKNVAVCIPADPAEVREGPMRSVPAPPGDAAREPPLKRVKLEPGVPPHARQPSGTYAAASQLSRTSSLAPPAPSVQTPSRVPSQASAAYGVPSQLSCPSSYRAPPVPSLHPGSPGQASAAYGAPSQPARPSSFAPPAQPSATYGASSQPSCPPSLVPPAPSLQTLSGVPSRASQPPSGRGVPSQLAPAPPAPSAAPAAASPPSPGPDDPPLFSQIGTPFGELPMPTPPPPLSHTSTVLAARSLVSQTSGPSVLAGASAPAEGAAVLPGPSADALLPDDPEDLCAGLDF